jgi:hypothetical protein
MAIYQHGTRDCDELADSIGDSYERWAESRER